MSDDPQQPGGEDRPEIRRETVRDLGAGRMGGTGGMPIPGGTGGIVMGGTGGIVMGGTAGMPAPTLTTILDREGVPKPGRYVIETRQTAEIEVLENGQVVVHRTETRGGAPEPQG